MDTLLTAASLATTAIGTGCCLAGRHTGVPAVAGMAAMLVAMADTMLFRRRPARLVAWAAVLVVAGNAGLVAVRLAGARSPLRVLRTLHLTEMGILVLAMVEGHHAGHDGPTRATTPATRSAPRRCSSWGWGGRGLCGRVRRPDPAARRCPGPDRTDDVGPVDGGDGRDAAVRRRPGVMSVRPPATRSAPWRRAAAGSTATSGAAGRCASGDRKPHDLLPVRRDGRRGAGRVARKGRFR
jgi:hypothetical protein